MRSRGFNKKELYAGSLYLMSTAAHNTASLHASVVAMTGFWAVHASCSAVACSNGYRRHTHANICMWIACMELLHTSRRSTGDTRGAPNKDQPSPVAGTPSLE